MNNSIAQAFQPEIQTLLEKKRTGSPVNYREVALVISSDEETLLKYMTDNDPVQMYRLLHESDAPMTVGKSAPFVPNVPRIEGELKLLFVKKDFATLNDIISNFVLNTKAVNYTTNQNILKSLEDMKTIVPTDNGYMFNVKFN